MTAFLQLTLALAILILLAKAGGYISFRLAQPAVLGELITGILLGPTLVNLLRLPLFTDEHLAEVIHQIAEIGVLLLMFLAGLELHISDLRHTGKVSALAGSLGVIFPILLGIGLGWLFKLPLSTSLYIGLILAATSVSISAQTLMEMKVLRSRVGIAMLGAAVFDDILVVFGLAVYAALVVPNQESGFISILLILVRMLLFLGIAGGFGYWILPRLSGRIARLEISAGLVSFTFVVLLLFAFFAEVLGDMAAITGAFLAGLVLGRSPVRERIMSGMSSLAYGIFVPIFFVNVGLSANIRALVGPAFWLFLSMLVVAVAGKVFGSGLGAILAGFSRQEALQLGVGMMSRGEVGLIVASVGIARGWLDESVFAAVVGVVIFTTLLTPPVLRSLLKKVDKETKSGKLSVEGE